MKVTLKKGNYTGGTALAIIVVFAGVFALLALWTDRNLEFWLSYFSDKPVEVSYWLSFLLTLVLNGFIVVANVVLEILRLIV